MNKKKEIAKFASGAEAFHALVHAYLWFSGTTLTIFGFTQTPTWNSLSAVGHGAVSVILGIYAWRSSGRRST